MKSYVRAAVAFAVASTVLAFSGQSHATVFAAWQVADVPFGDTLNARKYPSSTSQEQAAYPNGTVLQMTGRCTGGTNLLDIAGQQHWKQRQAIRYRWCEIWPDPARSSTEWSFRHRLGLRQVHHALLIGTRALQNASKNACATSDIHLDRAVVTKFKHQSSINDQS